MFKAIVAAVLAAPCALAYTTEALADQVTNMPGTEGLDIKFNQFSGYLNVNGSKELHYWLVESMNDPVSNIYRRILPGVLADLACTILTRPLILLHSGQTAGPVARDCWDS